ncbi:MAG: methyltransferase domain-containing protein [Pirellulales bacterium]|nr:methyltransferase domain-containing protein [Pirellulales bacterium]
MTISETIKSQEFRDWDRIYREGRPPWETGKPSAELERILREVDIPRGTALELGCGTGANAVLLSNQGFDVTAIDSSPTALERARHRCRLEDGQVHFVLADMYKFAKTAESYDLVFDRGVYHFARRENLSGFLDILWRTTRPGSYYLTLAGNANETTEEGPPRVSEQEIHLELGRLLDLVELRPFRFARVNRDEGYLAWSCLMRRPEPMTKP